MEKLFIDWKNMEEYSLIPIEYRFVDKAEVIPGKEACGEKAFSFLDWYFKSHFPGNPIVPGVFLMEVLQQTGMLIVTTMTEVSEKLLFFHSCESMRMYCPVRPGDIVLAYVELDSYKHGVARMHGRIVMYDKEKGEDKLVCFMHFTLLAIKELSDISSQMLKSEKYVCG